MIEIGEILRYEQPNKYMIESTEYKNEYKIPVLTAGQTFILGYTNEQKGVFPKEKLPVIIFDDFTTASKFVDFLFKVKSSAMKILHVNKKIADIKYILYKLNKINLNKGTHSRHWISKYSKTKISLPPLKEQKEIVEILDTFENKIDLMKELKNKYEIYTKEVTGRLVHNEV